MITITTSPLEIERYYWLDDVLICSILERNDQGWFIRKNGIWLGEPCDSEKDAHAKALHLVNLEGEIVYK